MKRMILGWLAAGILAVPMSAQALLVTVGGQAYDVNTVTGSFNVLESTLANQPFWGNSTLAGTLADATGGQLGLPNGTSDAGPLFAYRTGGIPGQPAVDVWVWSQYLGYAIPIEYPIDVDWTWATATPVPLPPALYLLGLGLAGLLGLGTRRRRQTTPI